MTTQVERVIRYYDSHKMKGEEVSQTWEHFFAIQYLLLVLQNLFLGQKVSMGSSINLFRTRDPKEKPLSPDIMVVDGLIPTGQDTKPNRSYYIGVDGPPPRIAFEMSSDKTWRFDLTTKLSDYAAMGIPEYIAFDPNSPTLWKKKWREKNRLIGWRLDSGTQQYVEIEKDEQGRLWSEQLQSWLAVDAQHLRLYTADGWQRLTSEEDERQRRETAERQRETAERQRETAEREVRLARQKADELAAKLRLLGHDPDNMK